MSKRPAHRGGAAESDDSDGTGDDPSPGPVVVARPGPPKRGRPPGATAKKKLEDPHYQCRWCKKTFGAKGGLRAHAREKHPTQYAAAGAGAAHVSHLGEWREGRVRLSATALLAPAPPMPARPRAPPDRPPSVGSGRRRRRRRSCSRRGRRAARRDRSPARARLAPRLSAGRGAARSLRLHGHRAARAAAGDRPSRR